MLISKHYFSRKHFIAMKDKKNYLHPGKTSGEEVLQMQEVRQI